MITIWCHNINFCNTKLLFSWRMAVGRPSQPVVLKELKGTSVNL